MTAAEADVEEEGEGEGESALWSPGAAFVSWEADGCARAEQRFAQRHRHLPRESLEAHNLCRLLHGTPPLRLSAKLCRHSRVWAQHLAKLGKMEARFNCPFGENLFLVWPTKSDYSVRGAEAVDVWYSGIRDYAFGCEPRNLLCLHFTQIVWRATGRLGVGAARALDGKIFIVANYAPRGNLMGLFAEQVAPPGGFPEEGSGAGPGLGPEVETGPEAEAGGSCRPFSAPQREGLWLHNDLRRRHNAPLLTLSTTLTRRATAWARQLADEDRHALEVDNPLGENVFSFVAGDSRLRARIGVRTALDTWCAEMRLFDFGQEPFDTKARNFTQMVWRSTRLLGMGVARGRGGRVIVVANYYPRGNVVGQYRDNVWPPQPPLVPAAAATPLALGEDEGEDDDSYGSSFDV